MNGLSKRSMNAKYNIPERKLINSFYLSSLDRSRELSSNMSDVSGKDIDCSFDRLETLLRMKGGDRYVRGYLNSLFGKNFDKVLSIEHEEAQPTFDFPCQRHTLSLRMAV